MTRLYRFRFALLLVCCGATNPAHANLARELTFKVWLDEQPVGAHAVHIQRDELSELTVTSRVEFKVKILFATVFDYEHTAHEQWRGDCLAQFESSTRSNGKTTHLTGQTTEQTFTLQHRTGRQAPATRDLGTCVGTYAYWDLQRLDRAMLMNTQTGELEPARLRSNGLKPIPRLRKSANAYALETSAGEILLWYSDAGEWLALETTTRGKQLVYVNESLLDAEIR